MRFTFSISLISLLLAATTFTNVQSAPIALPGGTAVTTTEITPTIESSLDIPTITPTTTTPIDVTSTTTAVPVITDSPAPVKNEQLFLFPNKGHSYIFVGNELGHPENTSI
ncbi:hypothetical protein HDU76_005724 [Blyttiomyces sp. JEL0837]|nr:hypothetical protein HDU76_005724 [Blyttiomyces sp. JEL0837]